MILRFFEGHLDGFLYRIYVTKADLLCVRMGRDRPVPGGYHGGGLVGGLAAGNQYQEAMRQYMRDVEEEGQMLDKRNAEGIRIYVRSQKRGHEWDVEDLEEVRIDAYGKWRPYVFFGSPTPMVVFKHKSKGTLIFTLPQKKDVVIALYELEQVFGEHLEVRLKTDPYAKAIKKYAKMRE